jgi:hypothetical protein
MAEEVAPLNLRERVRVPQVWLSGSLAAARRLARREVLESCDGDAGSIHDGDPDLLKPLAIPAIDPTLMDEPRRLSRRLQSLRGWGHAETDEVFSGSAGTGRADGD